MEVLEPDVTAEIEAAKDRQRAALVAQLVAFSFGEPPAVVGGVKRGDAGGALARRVAIYLAHVALEMPQHRVGAAFRRERTAVAKACHGVEDRRDDVAFDALLSRLEACLRLSPAFVGGLS